MINHLVSVAIWISCHIPINTAAIFRPLLKFKKMAEIPITNHLAIEYNYHTCVTETFDLVTLKLFLPAGSGENNMNDYQNQIFISSYHQHYINGNGSV